MRGPARERKFLTDPNYYRLGFQLAAQILNSELARRGERMTYLAMHSHRGRPRDPVEVAEQVLTDTQSMLNWYRDRAEHTAWWRPWVNQVRPHERRLMTFLAATVEPCTRLLVASALHEREDQDVEAIRGHVDDVISRAERNELSYRAYYSLACWHARLAGEGQEEYAWQSLMDLLRALRMAPRQRAPELAEWARKDPSFTDIRRSREADFYGIVAQYSRLADRRSAG